MLRRQVYLPRYGPLWDWEAILKNALLQGFLIAVRLIDGGFFCAPDQLWYLEVPHYNTPPKKVKSVLVQFKLR